MTLKTSNKTVLERKKLDFFFVDDIFYLLLAYYEDISEKCRKFDMTFLTVS